MGVGAEQISLFLNNLERYPISIRFEAHQREDIKALENLQIKTNLGYKPLKNFATLNFIESPSIIQSEKALKVAYVYISPKASYSIQQYKDEANELLKDIKLPDGYYFEWSGQSEFLQHAMDKLSYIIPLVLIFIFILIHMALRNIKYSLIIFLTLPFALSGGVFYIETLGFNFSIAVIVGFMALLGVAAETSIVMMLYLDEAIKNMKTKSIEALKEAIYHGAVLRLRPKLMTLFAILGGLIPIMYISSIGSEVMQRVAAPMIGGMVSSAFLTLFVIPTIFYIVISKDLKLNKE